MNKEKKKKEEKNRNRLSKLWILLFFLFINSLILYTWSKVQSQNVVYAIANETAKNKQLVNMKNGLTIELNHLLSPERITTIAKQQLGLNPPTQEQVRYITTD
ncbi:MAG: cell division protein FtsL [Desulfobacteraceae bacterium 4572_19]|nr:MAG: cell division protein FtsL [Desulfobacteraceae bacterium 4572_19]